MVWPSTQFATGNSQLVRKFFFGSCLCPCIVDHNIVYLDSGSSHMLSWVTSWTSCHSVQLRNWFGVQFLQGPLRNHPGRPPLDSQIEVPQIQMSGNTKDMQLISSWSWTPNLATQRSILYLLFSFSLFFWKVNGPWGGVKPTGQFRGT